jgi:superfamily II DNA/RNA helicase
MEAKALRPQDLTPNLTTDQTKPPTTTPVGTVALTMANGHSVPVLARASGAAEDKIIAPAITRPDAPAFEQLGVAEPICAALAAAGITTAFPIQALTLPIALDRHDVIGQARTGTGKTLAFAIPILQQLIGGGRGKPGAPRALVVLPTRELAIQVAGDLRTAASRIDVDVVTLYGGRAYEPQIEALASVDVVVGTPGRLLDLARQRQLDLSGVDVLVLDEADRMLDLGFLPDVEAILRLTPAHRQTMLFSATMPSEIVTLARKYLDRPTHIRAEQHDEPAHVPTTHQHVFRAHHLDKIEVLARVLQAEGRGLTIVFCRTRRACDQVTADLRERGFAAAAVHGDLGQSQRERALRAFRSGKIDVLVATDVAARGLDVDDVTHVVNNECPEDEKAYLHRIGRTGRAGRAGVAVTFVDWQDLGRWKLINDTLNLGHPEPLETYSTSAHLFTALGIPADAAGSLPTGQRGRAGLEAEDLEDIGETGKNRTHPHRSGSRQRGSDRTSGRRSSDRTSGRSSSDRTSGRSSSDRTSGRSSSDPVEPDQRASGRTRAPRRRTRAGAPVLQGGHRAETVGHADDCDHAPVAASHAQNSGHRQSTGHSQRSDLRDVARDVRRSARADSAGQSADGRPRTSRRSGRGRSRGDQPSAT